MFSQIKCAQHPEQDIILLDISQGPTKNRGLCSYCLEQIKPAKVCALDKLPAKINEFKNSKIEDSKFMCNLERKKFQTILKLIVTLKDKSEKMFHEIIKSIEQFIGQIDKNIFEELTYWENLSQNVTRTKLDEIAEILSESKGESVNTQIYDQFEQLSSSLMENFKSFVGDQKDTLNKIQSAMFKKWVKEKSTQCSYPCWALASNKKQQLVIGGVGKNIYVWEQRLDELVQQAVLNGHSDNVTALVIYNSGELFVSGGDAKAKSLKLWKKTDTWKCIQKLKEHSGGITDIQLARNEEQLFSASRDKTIKVWRMKNNTQLEFVQTLNEHTFEVYHISISPEFLISTSLEKYFNIYNREANGKQLWKKIKTVGTTGPMQRVLITEDLDAIIQMIYEPILFIVSIKELLQPESKNQKLKFQQPHDNKILAPMFQLGNQIYCVNENFVYVIKKTNSGTYFISQIIPGVFHSGCVDVTGNKILLGNDQSITIDIFGMF